MDKACNKVSEIDFNENLITMPHFGMRYVTNEIDFVSVTQAMFHELELAAVPAFN